MTSFLLQIRGGYRNAPNTDEIWQVGIRLWMDGSVPDNSGTFPALTIAEEDQTFDTTNGIATSNWTLTDLLNLEDYLDDVDQAVLAWQAGIQGWSDDCSITQVRLYPIDGDGKAVQISTGTAVAVLDFNSAQYGGSASPMLPLEVACAASFDTYKNNAKGRGRIYLPGQVINNMGSEGRFTDDFREKVAINTATLLGDLAVESLSPTQLHVRPVVTGPSDWDLYSVIKRVRVGTVPDAQRRRRNRVSEVYWPEDVVYG